MLIIHYTLFALDKRLTSINTRTYRSVELFSRKYVIIAVDFLLLFFRYKHTSYICLFLSAFCPIDNLLRDGSARSLEDYCTAGNV